MEKDVVWVVSIVVLIAALVTRRFAWRHGGDMDGDVSERQRVPQRARGHGRRRTLRIFVERIQRRIPPTKRLSEEEKKVAALLQTLKEEVETCKDMDEILRTVTLRLDEGVKLGMAYRHEVLEFRNEVVKLRTALTEDRRSFDNQCTAFENRLELKWKLDFNAMLGEKEQFLSQQEQEIHGKLRQEEQEIAKLQVSVGGLKLEARRRTSFVQCGDWNSLLHRLVAWNIGTSWFQVSDELKKEHKASKNWNGDMHLKVKRVLESFGMTSDGAKHLWDLSAVLQDGRIGICHDSSIRNLSGAALKSAIGKELAAFAKRRKGKADIEGDPDFNAQFDGLIEVIFTILGSKTADIDAMGKARYAMKQGQAQV